MKNLYRNISQFLFLLLIMELSCLSGRAQLIITDGNAGVTATSLAQALVGPGVNVSNAVLSAGCVNAPNAYGTFSGGLSTNLGISKGILLTTGDASYAYNSIGNDNDGIFNACNLNNTSGGDVSLQILAGASTYDACALEFDLVPFCDTISFNYVFGSEEYLEFVQGGFNDAFAFFISGPGIPYPLNIAVVPGTSIPVTINTINDVSNSSYYVDNGDGSMPSPGEIQYDGFTKIMKATTIVQACSTYHIKLVIADGGDCEYDSGVFLEAGNPGCYNISAALASSDAIEGCQDGQFVFCRPTPYTNSKTVNFALGGSAVYNVDYTLSSGGLSVTIPPQQACAFIQVIASDEGSAESPETVDLIYSAGPCMFNDTARLTIMDKFITDAGRDTSGCPGSGLILGPQNPFPPMPGMTYSWSPSGGLSPNNSVLNPYLILTGSGPKDYVLTTTYGSCVIKDTAVITTHSPPTSKPGNPSVILSGDSLRLGSSPQAGNTYIWRPSTGITPQTDSTKADPLIILNNPGPGMDSVIYMVLTTDTSTGCISSASVKIKVLPLSLSAAEAASGDFNESIRLHPNPFFSDFFLDYSLRKKCTVRIEIYTMLGEKIYSCADEVQDKGQHQKQFSAEEAGIKAGIYFIRISEGQESRVLKVVRVE